MEGEERGQEVGTDVVLGDDACAEEACTGGAAEQGGARRDELSVGAAKDDVGEGGVGDKTVADDERLFVSGEVVVKTVERRAVGKL